MVLVDEQVRACGVAAVGWILDDEFRAGTVGENQQGAQAGRDGVGTPKLLVMFLRKEAASAYLSRLVRTGGGPPSLDEAERKNREME